MTIYYESDHGPLPIDHTVSNMLESGHSDIPNQILNIEAEQQVLLEDGTFVNIGSEMFRIEKEARNTEIRLLEKEISTIDHTNKFIRRTMENTSHGSDPGLDSVPNNTIESVLTLENPSLSSHRVGESAKVTTKQTSILEYL